MRAWAACAFSAPHVTPWLASRAGSAARPCAARANAPGEPAETPQEAARKQALPVLLRDIFSPKSSGAGKKALLRLDRLQEVANLALEDRVVPLRGEEPWGCADIGTDHGLLAVGLHANGANVIAGDRAPGPLGVARENVRLYLRQAQDAEEPSAATAAPTSTDGVPRPCSSRSIGLLGADAKEVRERPVEGGVVRKGVGDGELVAAEAEFPRLECRLGEGLAVLEEGEVDTVCIAGVGVKTMIQILSAEDGPSNEQAVGGRDPSTEAGRRASLLSRLGVRRLVLQPMDARLEYMRDLRAWLRENGWRISQETIVSTLGKGGNHAFLTIRADCCGVGGAVDLEGHHGGWVGQSDWLGGVLPARATDSREGEQRQRDRREASTFLAYLRHQREWLRAIERARSPSAAGAAGGSSGAKGAAVLAGVDAVVLAVEGAIREAGGGPENRDASEPLVTSRRWRRSAG